ncbi:MAG: DUF975 family protein [Lachnospiraceae bacterium]|nr:DUF975 family protein [Lachnospiraceae bacterium]
MNGIRSSEELRADARANLLGRYLQVVPVHLLYLFASFTFTSLSADFSARGSVFALFISMAINLIGLILANVLHFGLCCFYMNLSCGYYFSIADIFKGFSFKDDRALRIAINLTLTAFLSEIPGVFIFALYRSTANFVLLPLAAIAICIGLSYYCIYYLGMSQCYYLLLDFPEKDISEIIRLSRWLMKGQKFKLFYLHMGFIPLYLLSILSCGIGLIWALPYAEETFTCFHLNLTSAAAEAAK